MATDTRARARKEQSASAAAPVSPAPGAERARESLARQMLYDVGADLTNFQLLKWMFRFVRPVAGLTLVACTWLTMWVATEMLIVRQAGRAVNHINTMRARPDAAANGFWRWLGSADPQAAHLVQLALALVALVGIYALLRYLKEVSNTKMSMNLVYYLREAVYDRLQRVGFGFHDVLSSGQLINRALSDLQHVRQFVQTSIISTLEIGLVVVIYIGLIFTVNPWLAGLAILPLPLWTVYVLYISRKVQPAAKAVMEAEDKNVSIIAENIAGVHVIRAFATEKHEVDKYGANLASFKQRVLKRVKLIANFQPVIRSIATASQLALITAGSILMIRGKLHAGHLMILGAAMQQILSRLQGVATINEQYQNAIVSARRLYEVLLAPTNVPEKPGAIALPAGPGRVEFDRITFGYDAAKPVLHEIAFDARGGSIVAIVGPTGAGKTSLVNLIARFYDPQAGSIRIDGIDLRDLTLASLRTQVAMVFQETYLFSDTIAANIAYGRPGISEGEIEAAARLAQAHEFIEQMPKGYKTVLRERGADLSGGQRQRLAIARAIVSNPRVLILDDATAAVDPETEDLIRRATGLVMKDRTTFVIAHRVSTVKRAGLVLVLEHGRLTQAGTHEELMRQPGHYRDIAAAQLYSDEEEMPLPTDEHPSHMRRVQSKLEVATAKEQATEEVNETMGK